MEDANVEVSGIKWMVRELGKAWAKLVNFASSGSLMINAQDRALLQQVIAANLKMKYKRAYGEEIVFFLASHHIRTWLLQQRHVDEEAASLARKLVIEILKNLGDTMIQLVEEKDPNVPYNSVIRAMSPMCDEMPKWLNTLFEILQEGHSVPDIMKLVRLPFHVQCWNGCENKVGRLNGFQSDEEVQLKLNFETQAPNVLNMQQLLQMALKKNIQCDVCEIGPPHNLEVDMCLSDKTKCVFFGVTYNGIQLARDAFAETEFPIQQTLDIPLMIHDKVVLTTFNLCAALVVDQGKYKVFQKQHDGQYSLQHGRNSEIVIFDRFKSDWSNSLCSLVFERP